MEKKPFLTEAMAQQIIEDVPTPFHVYDEKGIRENARRINKAFSWNKGFKEYFAVKALPNPVILQILKEEGCGVDCSSLTELMLSEVCGFSGSDIMFSSNQTPVEDMKKAYEDSNTMQGLIKDIQKNDDAKAFYDALVEAGYANGNCLVFPLSVLQSEFIKEVKDIVKNA